MPKLNDRIIIDTNLWLHFLITNQYSRIDAILAHRQITLLYSQQLIDEFIEVAQRPKFKRYFTGNDLQDLLLEMGKRALFIDVLSKVEACRDPKDNFLLELAKDGKATHLITGDKDLLALKKFEKTKIVTFKEYLGTL
jgi:uncharacterized protein